MRPGVTLGSLAIFGLLANSTPAFAGEPLPSEDWCPPEVLANAFKGMPLQAATKLLEKLEKVEELRILTPDSAATMDYRVGRINVIHEESVVMLSTCG